MRTFSRTLLTFLLTIVVGGIAVGACLAALIPGTIEIATAHHYTADQVGKLRALVQPSTIYWNDGTTEMATLGLHALQPISSVQEVPKRMLNAVIATEDRTFWTNDGIDLGAVFRAFLTNVTSGQIQQGGSTITQQLVKNRILSPTRDVNRKVKEIEDALRLNEKFSKDKILVEYLNTIYFGSGSYGIKAAAARFFVAPSPAWPFVRGKQMSELTIGEAALLAGVISNPEGDSPFAHPDRAIRRRADVLRSEVEEHYITQAQADAANNEPLPTVPPPAEQRPSDYLVAEVQDRLLADPRLGSTVKERQDKLLKGGLKVYTTFDQHLQSLAVNATENAKPSSPSGPDWISSLVSIDPSTGAVKAMVGGPDFADSQFNVATSAAGRQTGSTFKVITLATALSNGYSPNDSVDESTPCSVKGYSGEAVNDEPGGGIKDIWSATAGSVNCAFVRIATSVGYDKVIDMAHKMGITKDNLIPILNLTLGTREQNPETMATVMATIASGGIHHSAYVVQKVVGPDGKVLIDETGTGDRVLDPDVAACEQNILRGVVTGGTGTNALLDSHTDYGKTGTTDARADAWFIGATPQLATAVWFGNRQGNVAGAGFGGDSAAPIFKNFMDAALEGQPDIPLPDAGPVCARTGAFVNPDGGHLLSAPEPLAPLLTPGTPQPQIRQTPPATPTTPPATAKPTPTNPTGPQSP
jgi:penicillin-binding protein 1A